MAAPNMLAPATNSRPGPTVSQQRIGEVQRVWPLGPQEVDVMIDDVYHFLIDDIW